MHSFLSHKALSKCIVILVLGMTIGCGKDDPSNQSIHAITDPAAQDTIFRQLVLLTPGAITDSIKNDSLAFLILPLKASCPACRNKTIDSIYKYRKKLPANHFIILSASAGRKTINSFFLERDKKLPDIENRLFLDTLNMAGKANLYETNTVVYYTRNAKATRKILSIPATIKSDLQEFFTGHRKTAEEQEEQK